MKLNVVIIGVLASVCTAFAQHSVTPSALDFPQVGFTVQAQEVEGLVQYSITVKRKSGSFATFYIVRLNLMHNGQVVASCSLNADAKKEHSTLYRFSLSPFHIKGSTVSVVPFDSEATGSLLDTEHVVELERFVKETAPNKVLDPIAEPARSAAPAKGQN